MLDVSVAVQVTVVGPSGNVEPDAGRHATVTPGQLSCAAGNGKLTTAVILPGSAGLVMSGSWVMVGFWVSFTVTLKLMLATLPEASLAEQFTVVMPTGKTEPEAGVQLKVAPGQLSLAITV